MPLCKSQKCWRHIQLTIIFMQIMIFHYAGFLAQPLHILAIPRQGNVSFFFLKWDQVFFRKSLNLGGKAFNFFSVTSFLNDINVFYIIIICSFLIQGLRMSYLTFIFMGFITMLSKFAPDRYMNHISTSMIVVTCIDAYSHHKTDDWRLTLIKKIWK